ncbi:MAG TPA: diguanylate cyclase [Anaerolineales bacterium]|nr:diguanylate cyclase [Anaerolineales bacterium]
MNEIHSLLKRQLRRFADQSNPLIEEQPDFLRAINEAYWQFDADRRMLEHSLELTSQELLERNSELSRVNAELEMRVAARTAELSESEARFRGLFEYAPISIWEEDFSAVRQYTDDLRAAGVVDFAAYFEAHPETVAEIAARVKIVDVNRATLEMYRAESKAQLLADLSQVLGPASLISFKQEILALARGETSFESETINYTLGGEPRVIFLRLNVAPGCEQTWAKVFVGISDITERRKAEAALAAERDLLQALMDNIPDLIYFKDTASRFTRINRAEAGLLGVATPEEAIGKTDLDFQRPELARSFYAEEQRLVQTGESVLNRIEFNPTQDGQPRWLSTTKVPIKNEQGRVVGMVGISHDITQRKQVEEALRQSEERFRLMSWATKDAVWDWDLQRNQIWWGEGLQKILQYPAGTAHLDPEWRLDHIHPEDRQKVNRVIAQALDAGMEFWSKEYRFRRHDGTYADIMDRGYILHDDTGQPYRMIGAMMDITERKQFEDMIQQKNEMLSSLYQITLELLRYRDIDQLLHALVQLSSKFLDASHAEIMLVEGEMLVVKAVTQSQPRSIGESVGREEARLSWRAFDTHEPAVLRDYATWPERQPIYDSWPLHAVADFPILNDDRCIGVLSLGRYKPDYEFNLDQIQFGRLFANLTALVLNSAQLREALREQSIRDPLTGLYNRRYMDEALGQQLTRITRQLHPLSMIMMDIDHFKRINDTYGHALGDMLLRELGQLLKSHVRNEDIACRYGGEEFLVIMPDASLEATQKRAEYFRQAARKLRVQEAGQSLEGITLSLGVAAYPEHGRTKEAVLRAADTALYRAKQEGRDRVVVAETAG